MKSYRLSIWDEAETELLDAIEWYNAEREGLGDQLLLEVQRTFRLVEQGPMRFQRVQGALRRAAVHRFPFSVIFRLRDEAIEILAIIHQSRHPSRWQERRR